MLEIIDKLHCYSRAKLVNRLRGTRYYPLIYRAWWHTQLSTPKPYLPDYPPQYLSARPNPGAGIGHQLANWIAGLWFARHFNLKHAHIPFSTLNWEYFLGIGEQSPKVVELRKSLKYRQVLLPLFEENNDEQTTQIRAMINAYRGQRVVFLLEQDQFYREQYGVMDELHKRFYGSPARRLDKPIYSPTYFNIAIHIRRGDITIGQQNNNPNLVMRWQEMDYFINVTKSILRLLTTDKPIRLYIFSQGLEVDYADLLPLGDVCLCLDMDAQTSFLNMVYADLLITSKSSFSYKPALLSRGLKVVPRDFWHGYPQAIDWILADEEGALEVNAHIKLASCAALFPMATCGVSLDLDA